MMSILDRLRRSERPERNHEWPPRSGRPRVLLEVTDAAERDCLARMLTGAGYQVTSCSGPDAEHGSMCSLAVEGECPLVQGADLVVHHLRLSHPEHREVLRLLRARYGDVPIVVEAPLPLADRYRGLLSGCEVIAFPARRDDLLDAVAAALPVS